MYIILFFMFMWPFKYNQTCYLEDESAPWTATEKENVIYWVSGCSGFFPNIYASYFFLNQQTMGIFFEANWNFNFTVNSLKYT